jgi:hypothetical protein
MRSPLLLPLALLAVPLGGCSSSSSSASPPGDASGVDASPIEPACDGVVVAMDASGARLATDGTGVFVLTIAPNGHRVVSQLTGATLQPLADVPSDAFTNDGDDGTVPVLQADGDRFYVNTRVAAVDSIVAVQRADGGQVPLAEYGEDYVATPLFTLEGSYVYFVGDPSVGETDSFARVPVTGGPTELLSQRTYTPYATYAVDAQNVYELSSSPFAPFELLVYASTPPGDGGLPSYTSAPLYTLGECTRPGPLTRIDGGFVAGCTDDGGAPEGIYAAPILSDPTQAQQGTAVATQAGLDVSAFVVAGGNVYFDTGGLAPMDAGASGQPYVYRAAIGAAAGTNPAPLIRTGYVSSMVAVGAELFVAGACGIQQTDL